MWELNKNINFSINFNVTVAIDKETNIGPNNYKTAL